MGNKKKFFKIDLVFFHLGLILSRFMKVAIVHDWLTGMRGGERCLEGFCELFPDADIYTLFHIPGGVSNLIEKHFIKR